LQRSDKREAFRPHRSGPETPRPQTLRKGKNRITKIGYARVSTGEQKLDLQLDALKIAGCERVFRDEGVSGAAVNRPGLNKALAALGKGDVFIVWKLDRLGRSLPHLIEVIASLGRHGVGFWSLSESIDTTTASGKLLFHVMGALAEFERSLISERTVAGMAAAKKRGVHVGRPRKLERHQVEHARKIIGNGEETVAGMAAHYGVSSKTMSRELRQRKT
jgi:DNA invertase Pin-like site-specific DNA recombinase